MEITLGVGSTPTLGLQRILPQFAHFNSARVSMGLSSKPKAVGRESQKSVCVRAASLGVMAGLGSRSSKGGAGLLERPPFDQSQFFEPSTQVQEGGDIGRERDKRGAGSGDSYRVLLLDDERHTEKLVAKLLPQVVPSITPDDARRIFNESRQNGVAVVIVTVKEHAEFYSQMMTRGGLRSSIEPDSKTV